MTASLTIQAELRLPAEALAQGIATLERRLHVAGLLPPDVHERRWRPDAEAPGGYVLVFTCVLPEEPML